MLIRARGLGKTYQPGAAPVPALEAADLDVAEGEFVAIMGPSGSGKSTLLHLLGCLDRPSAGTYRLRNVAVESLGDRDLSRLRNTHIGFVFQAFNLLPQHRVLENVELPMIYGGVERRRRLERSRALLDRVGLGDKIDRRPTELSGGEAQRVAIARALATEPPLVLADEPTGSLDTATGEAIMQLFADLNARGTTILMTTHNPAIVAYADRVIEIKDGRIASDTRTPASPALREV